MALIHDLVMCLRAGIKAAKREWKYVRQLRHGVCPDVAEF